MWKLTVFITGCKCSDLFEKVKKYFSAIFVFMSATNLKKSPKVKVFAVEQLISRINPDPATMDELKLILSLIDLTTLEGKDTDSDVIRLCQKAIKAGTAAVCVYPSLTSVAKNSLKDTSIKVASVAGAFPSGQLPLDLRLAEASYAIAQGADEIDMVISRGKFLEGKYDFVFEEVAAFKKICNDKTLKVILETGELETLDNIRLASDIALQAGADFIKTSTGKINVNATLPAVGVMLQAIKDQFETTGKICGIKVSGGISDGTSAIKYLRLTEMVLGKEWLKPSLFRFGASRLVDNINV
jgi:deoxyribose-phosphate aldolase